VLNLQVLLRYLSYLLWSNKLYPDVLLMDISAIFTLVGRPDGKRPLGRPRRRWDDNIKDLREIGIDGLNWIQLAQDRVQWRACVNTVMNLRVP
jgi:hypothetical protein